MKRDENNQRVPETLDEFWCYLNTWAEMYSTHLDEHRVWREGYLRAVSEIMERFEAVDGGRNHGGVPQVTWMKWAGIVTAIPEEGEKT